MKQTITLGLLALLVLIAAACGGSPVAPAAAEAAAEPAAVQAAAVVPAAAPASRLDTGYEGALPQRNQLLLGTLRLEDSAAAAVTGEQAAKLLPLWQGIRATTSTGTASEAETNALLAQIEAALTDDQLTAIAAMQLTQTDLQEWGKSQGLSVGTGEGAAMGAGSGQSLSPEARATRRAERGGTGTSGGMSTALLDAVIELLEAK